MKDKRCPICESSDVKPEKREETIDSPTSTNFMITDAAYGKTGPLFKCESCGFLFVVYPQDATEYYTEMEDDEYEKGRAYRAIQQRILLEKLQKTFPDIRNLLDIGAGTGILLEEAQKMGIESVGVEPSTWCVRIAKDHGLNVLQGVLPHPDLADKVFDAVTAIDVIEHVSDPLALLESCSRRLKTGGALVVVTPDVDSITARLLRKRWWHYRIAHVGYFSKRTLKTALEKTGFKLLAVRRPAWYFEIGYLYQRLRNYLPLPKIEGSGNRMLKWFFSRKIPLNLRDSLEVIACKE